MDNLSLLPPNKSPLEQLISQTLSPTADSPSDQLIRSLWNAKTCPPELLFYLAQAVAVDLWDHRWSVQQKRDVIENALEIHRTKGTPFALLRALESRGIIASIREWWQDPNPEPNFWLPPTTARPGTIVIHTLINDNYSEELSINKAKLVQMDEAVAHAKRESIEIAMELGLKWNENLALSLCTSSAIMTSDQEAEISPLHPEPATAHLTIKGASRSLVLADHNFTGVIP